jgi:glc operon protein GlcG
MRKYNYLLLLTLTFIFLSKLAFSLETKPVMDLNLAKKMADACETKKSTTDWRPLNIAIVDSGSDLVLFRRQDGAFLGSIDIALNKAKSAVMIPYPTRVIGELAYGKEGVPGRLPGISTVDFLVPFPGGMPIRTQSGELIGAIGVSGATGDQDEECAIAAIEAVQDLLK